MKDVKTYPRHDGKITFDLLENLQKRYYYYVFPTINVAAHSTIMTNLHIWRSRRARSPYPPNQLPSMEPQRSASALPRSTNMSMMEIMERSCKSMLRIAYTARPATSRCHRTTSCGLYRREVEVPISIIINNNIISSSGMWFDYFLGI